MYYLCFVSLICIVMLESKVNSYLDSRKSIVTAVGIGHRFAIERVCKLHGINELMFNQLFCVAVYASYKETFYPDLFDSEFTDLLKYVTGKDRLLFGLLVKHGYLLRSTGGKYTLTIKVYKLLDKYASILEYYNKFVSQYSANTKKFYSIKTIDNELFIGKTTFVS